MAELLFLFIFRSIKILQIVQWPPSQYNSYIGHVIVGHDTGRASSLVGVSSR